MIKLIPLQDYVILDPVKEENTTTSGIIIKSDNKEKPSKGKVIAVGTGKILDNGNRAPIDIAVGDTVYFTKYAPEELEVDGTTYLIIKQSSVLAKQ